MAVWKLNVKNANIKINSWDHLPPHCHVEVAGRRFQVELETLRIRKPKNAKIPPATMRTLKEYQEEMLRAWAQVMIVN